MVEFHVTKGIAYHLDRIIEQADKEIILISPFIDADSFTREIIERKKGHTEIHVVYGKEELKPVQKSFFEQVGITTYFRKNLHAKCYLNEKEALLTSMNPYRFSQQNNDEMGILISKKDDKTLYEAVYEQALRWKDASESDMSPPGKKRTSTTPRRSVAIIKSGACIRCGAEINADPAKPFCKRHWRYWNKTQYDDYEHSFCHTCGKEHSATRLKPACYPCYKKYKDVFEFPAA